MPYSTFTLTTLPLPQVPGHLLGSSLPLKSFPPDPTALPAHPLEHSSAGGPTHETACSACQPCAHPPAHLVALVVAISQASRGGHTARHFLSLHPTPRPGGTPPPPLSPSCFPGRSIQDTPLPGVRVPHSSGFTPPWGGLRIPAWGVRWGKEAGREVGREKFSRGRLGLLCPLLWDQGHGAGRATGAARAPSRVGRSGRKPLSLSGFGRETRPSCRHSRNCKKPTRT